MLRFVLALVVFGGMLMYRGYQELRIALAAHAEAQRVTLAQLETNGYGSNAHVLVSDIYLVEGGFIYERDGGEWKAAWVPAVPRGSEVHMAQQQFAEIGGTARSSVSRIAALSGEIRSVVKLPAARRAEDVTAAARKRSLRGIVVNDIETLRSDARSLLAKSYPTLDVDGCVILEVGRSPPGWIEVFLWLAGGLACLGGAGFLMFVRHQEQRGARSREDDDEVDLAATREP